MKARGVMEHHRRRQHERQISIFSFDYLHIDESGDISRGDKTTKDEKTITVLVATESRSGCIFAHIVPQKGVDREHYVVDALVEDIKWLGFQRLILKSDNEAAILKLLSTTLQELRFTIPDIDQLTQEHPNVYDSSGNC